MRRRRLHTYLYFRLRRTGDPERDIHLEKLDYRSIQIGLSGKAVPKYVNEWIVAITEITPHCKKLHSLISEDIKEAINYLPKERLFPSS